MNERDIEHRKGNFLQPNVNRKRFKLANHLEFELDLWLYGFIPGASMDQARRGRQAESGVTPAPAE